MKKTITFLVAMIFATGFSQEEIVKKDETIIVKKKLEIPQGTIIKAKLIETIKGGKAEVGEEVSFELAEPVIIGDLVYLHKGLKIIGFITEAKSSGILGKKGKLGFTINYLYLTDGKVIKLRGEQNQKLKGSGLEVAAAAVILTPVALLIPGKGAKYEAGAVFDVYTDENFTLE